MRICFFHSDKPRESILADAFIDGLDKSQDEGFKRNTAEEFGGDFDVACMVGVKSRELMRKCWDAGIHTVYFDKGYLRHSVKGPVKMWQYWRVAVDGHHPTNFLARARCENSRFNNFHLPIPEWKEGTNIVIAGSSQKYHDFYGLFDPTRYAHKLVSDIRKISDRPIIYRPKPSWHDAEPVDGTHYSGRGESISDVLKDAHVLITHGSNSCFEAVLSGVPCIILGDGVAKPISSVNIEDVENPWRATMEERQRWLSNLAYCQWTLREMAAGKMWSFVRPQIYG